MEFQLNCQFNQPVNLGSESKPDWEFSKIICSGTSTDPVGNPNGELPAYVSLVSENGKEFYLFKTWDYGSLFISFFIFVLILFFIVKGILGFFLGKFVKIEKKGGGRLFS